MKFVALAILLAVGCQADSLQADAPPLLPYVEQAGDVMGKTLFAMQSIGDTVFKQVEETGNPQVVHVVIAIRTWIGNLSSFLATYKDQALDVVYAFVLTIDEATKDMRDAIDHDLSKLSWELQPKIQDLEKVVTKHLLEYREILEQKMFKQKHIDEFHEQMATWRTKLEPMLEDLNTKIAINVEETKWKMIPIANIIHKKMIERLQKLLIAVEPYVPAYMEAYNRMRANNFSEYKKKLAPHFNAVMTSFTKLINEIQSIAEQ